MDLYRLAAYFITLFLSSIDDLVSISEPAARVEKNLRKKLDPNERWLKQFYALGVNFFRSWNVKIFPTQTEINNECD